jgi:hypothetical protein
VSEMAADVGYRTARIVLANLQAPESLSWT